MTVILQYLENQWIFDFANLELKTDDNYSIRFEISNDSSTIRFDSIQNEKKRYSHSTNIFVTWL